MKLHSFYIIDEADFTYEAIWINLDQIVSVTEIEDAKRYHDVDIESKHLEVLYRVRLSDGTQPLLIDWKGLFPVLYAV